MLSSLISLVLFALLLVLFVYLFGEYIAWVYREESGSRGEVAGWLKGFQWLDRFFTVCEKVVYRLIGLDEDHQMNWLGYLKALLIFNLLLFILLFLIFYFQYQPAALRR